MDERRGRLLLGGALVPGRVRFAGGVLREVLPDPPGTRASDLPIVAPGLIDLHVHGFGGCDPLEDLEGMARALAAVGTTSFLPTLFPDDPARLGASAARAWKAARASPARERILGLHLEGPFVNPRSAGALPVARLAEPSPAGLKAILGPRPPGDPEGAGVRIMTLAPELPGAPELVRELAQCGVRVSLGHSLAKAAEARAAAGAGATGATHLFNAMGPIHHREAGLAGFALSGDALVAEIIGDLVHVGREAFELALRARGPLGLALVSDALRGAGTGCDVFHSHGLRCAVRDGAVFVDEPEGRGRLAGAAAPQLEAVRRLVKAGVATPAEALTMASESPARALGIEDRRGRLAVGARAELVVLGGEELELLEVIGA